MADERPKSLLALRDARERSIALLSDAFAHDDLELEEFERRLGLAHRSDSIVELEGLTADLTAPSTALTPAAAPAAAVTTALVPGRVRDRQSLVAVMGGTSRKGYWTPPRRLRVVTVIGGAELDFREAALLPGVTEVVITAVLGGVSITVPPQLAVEMDGIAIMGGFEHSERAPAQLDPDRPVLRIRGVAVLGGVEIKTRLVGESDTERHQRRHGPRALTGKRRKALPAHEE